MYNHHALKSAYICVFKPYTIFTWDALPPLSFPAVWHSVIELSVVCILVVVEAGVAALGGVFIVFLTQPIQVGPTSLKLEPK